MSLFLAATSPTVIVPLNHTEISRMAWVASRHPSVSLNIGRIIQYCIRVLINLKLPQPYSDRFVCVCGSCPRPLSHHSRSYTKTVSRHTCTDCPVYRDVPSFVATIIHGLEHVVCTYTTTRACLRFLCSPPPPHVRGQDRCLYTHHVYATHHSMLLHAACTPSSIMHMCTDVYSGLLDWGFPNYFIPATWTTRAFCGGACEYAAGWR